MKRSDTITEISKALAKAQGEFAPVIKGKTAQISNTQSYSYADLASVCEAIVPVLSKNSIAVIQGGSTDHEQMETLLCHASGEWIATYTPVYMGRNGGAQGYGSGATYARRYGLLAAVGVAPEDDDDGKKASGENATAQAPVSADQFVALRDLIEETGSDEAAFLRAFNAPGDLQQFPAAKFHQAKAALERKRAKGGSNAAA